MLFDFTAQKKWSQQLELFELLSFKTYRITCICAQIESKDAGYLLYGATPFTSTELHSGSPALLPHSVFPPLLTQAQRHIIQPCISYLKNKTEREKSSFDPIYPPTIVFSLSSPLARCHNRLTTLMCLLSYLLFILNSNPS